MPIRAKEKLRGKMTEHGQLGYILPTGVCVCVCGGGGGGGGGIGRDEWKLYSSLELEIIFAFSPPWGVCGVCVRVCGWVGVGGWLVVMNENFQYSSLELK